MRDIITLGESDLTMISLFSQWSTEGVGLMSENKTHYTCQSSHLTSFAVLVSVTPTEVPAILSESR